MEKLYGLSGSDLNRVSRAVLSAERQQREGQGSLDGLHTARNIQFVQLTSLTPSDGAYPCRVMSSQGDNDTWISFGKAWARPANATAVLKLNVKYPALMVGSRVEGAASKAIFRLFDACCVPSAGTPETYVMSCGGHDSHEMLGTLWVLRVEYSTTWLTMNSLRHHFFPMIYDALGADGAGWYSAAIDLQDGGGQQLVYKIFCDSGTVKFSRKKTGGTGYELKEAVSLECLNTKTAGTPAYYDPTDCSDQVFRLLDTGINSAFFLKIDEQRNYLTLLQPVPEGVQVQIQMPAALPYLLGAILNGVYFLPRAYTSEHGHEDIPEYTLEIAASDATTGSSRTFRLVVSIFDWVDVVGGIPPDRVQVQLSIYDIAAPTTWVKVLTWTAVPEEPTFSAWAPGTTVAAGDIVTNAAGTRWFLCLTPGLSGGVTGATQPDWGSPVNLGPIYETDAFGIIWTEVTSLNVGSGLLVPSIGGFPDGVISVSLGA